MKFKNFGSNFLNEDTLSAAQEMTADNDRNRIVNIDVHDIIPNEGNFYGIRDIDELAGMISASGYIEPLVVKPKDENGKYKLIAGDRRRNAKLLLLERGEHVDASVPCIIRAIEAKGTLTAEEVETSILIFSNQKRNATVQEQMEESKRLEPIAKKIYDEESKNGNVSGSFRKFFAENFLHRSETAAQRLKAMENLSPTAMEAVTDGKISPTAASVIATLSPDQQDEYLQRMEAGEVSGTVADIQSEKEVSAYPAAVKEALKAGKINIDQADYLLTLDENAQTTQLQAFKDAIDGKFPANIQTALDSERITQSEAEKLLELTPPEVEAYLEKVNEAYEQHEDTEDYPEAEDSFEAEEDPAAATPSDFPTNEEKPMDSTTDVAAAAAVQTPPLPPATPAPAPKPPVDLTGQEGQNEADQWIIEQLTDSKALADERCAAAREANNSKEAVIWNLRSARLEYVISMLQNA